jgi:hypothetical protein
MTDKILNLKALFAPLSLFLTHYTFFTEKYTKIKRGETAEAESGGERKKSGQKKIRRRGLARCRTDGET